MLCSCFYERSVQVFSQITILKSTQVMLETCLCAFQHPVAVWWPSGLSGSPAAWAVEWGWGGKSAWWRWRPQMARPVERSWWRQRSAWCLSAVSMKPRNVNSIQHPLMGRARCPASPGWIHYQNSSLLLVDF